MRLAVQQFRNVQNTWRGCSFWHFYYFMQKQESHVGSTCKIGKKNLRKNWTLPLNCKIKFSSGWKLVAHTFFPSSLTLFLFDHLSLILKRSRLSLTTISVSTQSYISCRSLWIVNILKHLSHGMLCFGTLDMLYFRTFHNLFKHLTYTK